MLNVVMVSRRSFRLSFVSSPARSESSSKSWERGGEDCQFVARCEDSFQELLYYEVPHEESPMVVLGIEQMVHSPIVALHLNRAAAETAASHRP